MPSDMIIDVGGYMSSVTVNRLISHVELFRFQKRGFTMQFRNINQVAASQHVAE